MLKEKPPLNIRRKAFDAVLFDLDGVITRTAEVHAISWKKLFDEYLESAPDLDEDQRCPFDEEKDYRSYVDGKPRYQGVQSFLESRGIFLDQGDPHDLPGEKTICGLGNRKNQIFHEYLEKNGVNIHKGSKELVLLLKQKGFKTAVVTSSRNCSLVLKAAELENLFDVQVDGLVSGEMGLKGKPHPDIFLEAARQLNVLPERTMVFEDALAGVESGRKGNFGCVVGVDRIGQKERLLEKGADIVVKDLSSIQVEGDTLLWATRIGSLPSALHAVHEIAAEAQKRKLLISLDYDGTLTPIVDRPEMAVLSDNMRKTLKEVSSEFPVIIISGRDLGDIRDLVGLEELIYAGSHGFDISSPREIDLAFQMGEEFLPVLDQTETLLEKEMSTIEGSLVERKKFSIAVHYRLVPEDQVWKVEKMVDHILAETPELRKGFGKMVFELKPDIDWDKGKALLWLLEGLKMDMDKTLPLYIGDDITDEDAFLVLQGSGIGIVVREGESLRNSMARYSLENTMEVRDFLQMLVEIPREGGRS